MTYGILPILLNIHFDNRAFQNVQKCNIVKGNNTFLSKICSIYFDSRYFDTLAHYLCCPYIFKMDHKKSLYQMTYGTFLSKGEENLIPTIICKLKLRLVATVSSRLISHVILCADGGVNGVGSWHFLSKWANSFGKNTQFSQCGNSYSMVSP